MTTVREKRGLSLICEVCVTSQMNDPGLRLRPESPGTQRYNTDPQSYPTRSRQC